MWSKLRVKSQFYFFSMNLHSDMWKATEWLRCLPVFKIGIKISSRTFSLFFFSWNLLRVIGVFITVRKPTRIESWIALLNAQLLMLLPFPNFDVWFFFFSPYCLTVHPNGFQLLMNLFVYGSRLHQKPSSHYIFIVIL